MSRTKPPSPPTSSSSAPAPSPKTFTLNAPSRQRLNSKQAKQLLAPLSAHPYTTINLSGCALEDSAAMEAGPRLLTLANKHSLQTVILSDVIASLPAEVALRTLSTLASSIGVHKRLQSVDLSHNALGSRGLAECAPLINGQPHLRSLFLIESGLAAASSRLLLDYFAAPTTALRVLDLHGNRLESQGLNNVSAIVAKSPQLKRLCVSSVGASASAIAGLARALEITTSLTELDLSDNSLDRDGAIALADILVSQNRLSRLALADLSMGDDTLTALLVPLTTAQCSIAELLLAGNDLTAAAVTALARYLRAHSTELRVLDLSTNELGDAGVTRLAEAVHDAGAECALTKVLIAENNVSATPIVRLAQELVKLPGIRRFDIRGHRVPTRVGEALSQAFGPGVVLWDVVESDVSASAGEGKEEAGSEEEKEREEREEEERGPDFEAPAEEDGIQSEDQQPDDGERVSEQLEEALQRLADTADAVERPTVSQASSIESRSVLSRFGELLSLGSSRGAASSGVEDTAKGSQISSRVEEARGVSIVEDSGIIGNEDAEDTPTVERGAKGTGDGDEFSTPVAQTRSRASTQMGQGETEIGTVADESQMMGSASQSENGESVLQSTRKLRDSVARLSREIGDVATEIATEGDMPRRQILYSSRERGEGDGNEQDEISRYLLVSRDSRTRHPRTRKDVVGELTDACGALLVAIFIAILVTALVQSQDEETFSYAPV